MRTLVRAARCRRAQAALTQTHASLAAPMLSSPLMAARDPPSAVPPLPVLSDAVSSAPGPFKPEDYVLSPALVRVRLPARSTSAAHRLRLPRTCFRRCNSALPYRTSYLSRGPTTTTLTLS